MRKASLFVSPDGDDRNLILYDGMTPENRDLVLNEKFEKLTLSYGDWDDLSVFSLVSKKIACLSINCYGSVNFAQLSALNRLKRIEVGAIERSTVPREKLDFSWFPELEYCEADLTPRIMRNFSACSKLSFLQVRSYKAENLSEISSIKTLRGLSLVQSVIPNLDGIEELKSLEVLRLGAMPKLVDIARISELPNLKDLSIEKCVNIENLEVIFSALELREIGLRGEANFSSMRQFLNLKNIEIINVDAQFVACDFRALLGMKSLRKATFIDLKNCDLNEDDFHDVAAELGIKVEAELLKVGKRGKTVLLNIARPSVAR
jgi:hypothetical protein